MQQCSQILSNFDASVFLWLRRGGVQLIPSGLLIFSPTPKVLYGRYSPTVIPFVTKTFCLFSLRPPARFMSNFPQLTAAAGEI